MANKHIANVCDSRLVDSVFEGIVLFEESVLDPSDDTSCDTADVNDSNKGSDFIVGEFGFLRFDFILPS